jgi:hypothetical protein
MSINLFKNKKNIGGHPAPVHIIKPFQRGVRYPRWPAKKPAMQQPVGPGPDSGFVIEQLDGNNPLLDTPSVCHYSVVRK